MEELSCKTCKTSPSEDGEVRCRLCHRAFRAWLDGGAAYRPLWDGVISGPVDADKPVSRLDRALSRRYADE